MKDIYIYIIVFIVSIIATLNIVGYNTITLTMTILTGIIYLCIILLSEYYIK